MSVFFFFIFFPLCLTILLGHTLRTPPLPLVLGLRETLSCWSSATQRRPPGTEVDVLPVCLIVSSMQIVHTIPAVTHMDVPTMSVRVYVPYFSLSHSRPCMLPDRPPVLHVVSKSHRSDPLACAGAQSSPAPLKHTPPSYYYIPRFQRKRGDKVRVVKTMLFPTPPTLSQTHTLDVHKAAGAPIPTAVRRFPWSVMQSRTFSPLDEGTPISILRRRRPPAAVRAPVVPHWSPAVGSSPSVLGPLQHPAWGPPTLPSLSSDPNCPAVTAVPLRESIVEQPTHSVFLLTRQRPRLSQFSLSFFCD